MQYQYVWSRAYVDAMVERDTPTQRFYVQQDANWNVTALVNTSGSVVERYVYDPYGAPTYLNAIWSTLSGSAYSWVYLHQGGRLDNVTGLYNSRYRDYSPGIGRWSTTDSIGFLAHDLNLYRYVSNLPTTLTDPTGLWSWGNAWIGAGTGAAMGATGFVYSGPFGTFTTLSGGIIGFFVGGSSPSPQQAAVNGALSGLSVTVFARVMIVMWRAYLAAAAARAAADERTQRGFKEIKDWIDRMKTRGFDLDAGDDASAEILRKMKAWIDEHPSGN